MPVSCSIKLKADKLPKIFNKVEFFLFRAMEQKGMDFYKISQQPKTAESIQVFNDIKEGKLTKEKLESLIGKKYTQGLLLASKTKLDRIGTDAYRIAQMVHLFDTIKNSMIPEYVTDYIENAKELREQGKEEGAKEYENFAANLQNLVAMWNEIGPNFLSSSDIFSVNTKFKMDEEGLVDLSEVADDEKKMLNKMVFDRPANEIDPIDDVDKAVELFLKSIHVEDDNDEYGYTVNVDYATFVKDLFNDLQDSIGLDELLTKLEKNKIKIPEYQQVIDKLKIKPNLTSEEVQFRINFTNSFAKAFIPIMITSIEKSGTSLAFKVLEASSGKSSVYEKIVSSNFTSRGMRVSDGENTINLAHQVDGVWMLTKEDIPKLREFLNRKNLIEEQYKARRVEFLKGIGFEFSQKTEEFLKNSSYLNTKFNLIFDHLIKAIEQNPYVLNPVLTIKQKVKNLSNEEKDDKRWSGQNNNITNLIAEELKNNTSYNIEKSVITAEGTRQHAIQLHNNFTVLNKYFSGVDAYPTLQSILESEPSMFWMDPTKNPNIRSSYYLNSLFYFDPADPKFGQRRKVKNGEYSNAADAEPVKLTILNTGGLQLKLLDDFEKEGASSTSLNELDKILQDLHGFFASRKGYAGVLRLGDKSTDLGIGLNYGLDANTGNPIDYGKPLGKELINENIFTTESFKKNIKNALRDYLEMRYLGEKGFFNNQDGHSGLKMGSENFKNWGYFEDVLKADTKKALDEYIKELVDDPDSSIDMITVDMKIKNVDERINRDIKEYFTEKSLAFFDKINNIRSKFGLSDYSLIGRKDLKNNIAYYIANTFITDLDQMKIFFGDPMYFKTFHKRSSKDSATGVFTMMDDYLIDELNDESNSQGYGINTNLSAKRLIERVYESKLAELEKNKKLSETKKEQLRKEYKQERDQALLKQIVSKSFKSAVLKDVNFVSEHGVKIINNIDRLVDLGYMSDAMKELYKSSIKDVISNKYNGVEADGQGKCTFDFYRIMSIATSSWLPEQEEVYKKIVDYNHYDELAEETDDDQKRAEYISKRDAVGYDPTEPVYFPPRKFQYSGPEMYTRFIDGQEYNTMPPIFDKFSLQPLIPTVIKKGGVKTADWHLARKMEYNGISYVKFESASKVETPSDKDEFYSNFDPNNPSVRQINKFQTSSKFKSEQELFFNHFKEQVAIDAEIHDNAIFGSQIRKLILMNLDRPEFKNLKDKYVIYLGQLAEIEKTALYNEMGIKKVDDKLKVTDMKKVIDYFFNEISKKNQDINVRKALNYDEATGKFDIPLDATVQAQVLEGIIISAINNRVVRYKTNGSMLVQMAITGSEAVKFNADSSAKALETYGDGGLKYYDIIPGKDGQPTISKMDVKISLTGQWLNLLNLDGLDKRTIGTIERLNEALLNDEWRALHEKKLSMIAYRIPTAGRNFLDVMLVKEFLPAALGDAIIMPKEIVIKNGGDFDIDKMFVFYPNITDRGNYMEGSYTQDDVENPEKYKEVKGIVQNRLYEVMADVILHPSNYMELVTPSTNFHIMPFLDKIFEKLGAKEEGKDRQKTDYKNTKILDRTLNYQKFLSLLKGKSDLGIAAVANTFNVLFQLANANSNSKFLSKEQIKTFFDSLHVEKSKGFVTNIDFSSVMDEDGVLKSEFFSEFINAFVDVANDDYVFAANVVTELSPIMFYMKFAGMGSGKILNFMNQPAIRKFTKNVGLYQNKFIKLNGIGTEDFETARRLAMDDVLTELGYFNITSKDPNGPYNRKTIEDFISERMKGLRKVGFDEHFTEQALLDSIKPDSQDLAKLTPEEKVVQLAMLLELENLREQSNSITDTQKFLNFDTNPFSSSFDVYVRNEAYKRAILPNAGNSILSPATIEAIKKDSMISPLDMSKDIAYILADLFPVRNDIIFNNFLLKITTDLKDKFILQGQDDMMKFARTAKNDYMTYILQNNIGKSEEGMKFFHETFETNKGFNEYLAELVQTPKLVDMWNAVKDMTDLNEDGTEYNVFSELVSKQYPFVKNIALTRGDTNNRLVAFQIIESSSNKVDKNSVITQFNDLSNLTNPKYKLIRDFFRNLALYSTFQSGMNTSDVSYTNVTPVGIVNKLYGYATTQRSNEYSQLSTEEKLAAFNKFYKLFVANNPLFFKMAAVQTPTLEKNSRGKWYAEDVQLQWQSVAEKEGLPEPPPVNPGIKVVANIPQNKVSGVDSKGSLVIANDKAIKKLGPAPHSIDMIIAGLRTRTTRSSKEMDKYAVKVGDIIKHFGTSADGNTKQVLARVTAIHEKGTPGWKGTWEKEGWRLEDVNVIDKFAAGAVAIEFELLYPAGSIKVISDADVASYNSYLAKSKGQAPKEFFTSATTFKEFYNPATSKREKAPQSSKWVLQENGLYNLVDKDGGEVYIENVDLRTGMKTVEIKPTVKATQPVNKTAAEHTNYSGAADGADKTWAAEGKVVGIGKQVDYRPETLDKLTPEQYKEAEDAYRKAAKALDRPFLDPKSTNKKVAYAGKLMTRDYLQAKAGEAVFAISDILNPGEVGKPSSKGVKYENTAGKQVVDGGTGYAVEMAIQLRKPVYVFHQGTDPNHKTAVGWYKWDGKQFVSVEIPTLTKKYAGVGTRHINAAGIQAIKDVYQKTFGVKPSEAVKATPVMLSSVKPNTNILESRVQIQSGFYDYGKLTSEDEKTILDEAIKQTNKQGYPVKKAVVYAHWGNMWAVTDKGADAFPVFGKHLRRSEESAGLGKGLKKIDLPKSNIEHNDGGKGWYDYYPTDQNGNKLDAIPEVIKDILQKKLGLDMSVYDSAIINSYGETTELSRHIDNTEDKGYAYKIPIVSISLIGDSVFQYSDPSDNPNHSLPDNKQISLAPGQVVVFGGASRAMAHRVLNGKSGNAVDIKNSVDSLKTERINITLRRALPLTKEEYNRWVNNNKVLRESSKEKITPSEMTIEDKITNWIEQELPWTVSTLASQLAEMYNKEKLSSETIEEYLNRLSCLGKLI